MVEVDVPYGGGDTGWGTVTLMPAGTLPTQATEKVTGELNPPIELTITLTEVLSPCVVESTEEDGDMEKSGTAATEATGTKAAVVPGMLTVNSVVCKIPAPLAVIESV